MDCLLFTFSYCLGCENGYGHEQAVSEDLPGYPNVERVYAECGEVTAQRGRLRGSWSAVCCLAASFAVESSSLALSDTEAKKLERLEKERFKRKGGQFGGGSEAKRTSSGLSINLR